MSLSLLRPYFKERCEKLNYKEHPEAFDGDNVAAVSGAKKYFVKLGQVRTDAADHQSVKVRCDVGVQLYSKGSRNTIDAADAAFADAEKLITSVLRKDQTPSNFAIKNVSLNTFSVEPFAQSNDNSVIGKFEFTATVILELNL